MGGRGASSSNEKINLAKQIARKMGFSEGNYRTFLQPEYYDGYNKTKGKAYTVTQLKKQLKELD